jgi:hypothetical protein
MSMKKPWAFLPVVVALAAGAALSAPGPALAADAAVAVLGVEASEGAPEALASTLTDALRQRVSATKGFHLVPGRDLVEVKLVFSCPDEAPSCMAQAGKSLGAVKLIFGSVKRLAGDSYLVTLKLLDTTRVIVDAFVGEQLSKSQATGAGALRVPVQKWFATLTGQGGAGSVRVRGDVIGASVALDGTPSGTIGTDDLPISSVTPGKHDLVVTKPGYDPVRKEVLVASGETAQVSISMTRSAGSAVGGGPGGGPPLGGGADNRFEDREGHTALKTATWLVLGAGVVGVALGVKFGLDVQKINSDLDGFRRFACPPPNQGMQCNTRNEVARPLTMPEITYVNAKKDDGRRLETYQYISYGVGGALVLSGAYLFYRAYLDENVEPRAALGPSISVLPVIGPDQAGFSAALRF